MKFVTRPVYIDAIKYDGTPAHAESIVDYIHECKGEAWVYVAQPPTHTEVWVKTREGTAKLQPTYYLIKGNLPGEFTVEKPTIFHARYEEVKS